MQPKKKFLLRLGDCREVLAACKENCVDSVVTDPPYGLSKEPKIEEVLTHWLAGDDYKHTGSGFMGKSWDSFVPGPQTWKEIFRVLKPGGHLLCFAGSRTVDLMGISLRMAGFEIRDQIQWVYGSGFPKSLDVSKAIDKAAGAEREKIAVGNPVKRLIPGADQDKTGSWVKDNGREYQPGVELPTTEEAKKWAGFGTALKPAHEPIIVCRKPLLGTVAANVLMYGTGGLNIDGCRVGDGTDRTAGGASGSSAIWNENADRDRLERPTSGRFPANLIHDGSEEVLAAFPQTVTKSSGGSGEKSMGALGKNGKYGTFALDVKAANAGGLGDSGTPARFFYCAKASKSERGEGNNHPTVKPLALMRYLVRLVTPPGGMVLDPFTGSGTTGVAATEEGFKFFGVTDEQAHLDIATRRIQGV